MSAIIEPGFNEYAPGVGNCTSADGKGILKGGACCRSGVAGAPAGKREPCNRRQRRRDSLTEGVCGNWNWVVGGARAWGTSEAEDWLDEGDRQVSERAGPHEERGTEDPPDCSACDGPQPGKSSFYSSWTFCYVVVFPLLDIFTFMDTVF